ncbi:GntR family transcriptional regulator [Thalassoroseus pseudoceratinae]|uniref:GntR family transcriptional regulator n=1 Tax=Thalassoroseus pseudoceratinae TaxID=2713176 RepID=UPI0014229D14|nr:GntR family transcriptional regulator [Thalassoroseus pseudoceratinae]
MTASDDASLVDDVYHQILLRIVHQDLPGGTELKSTRLAADMGVSRTPVVQALGRLAADGIVMQQRNHRAVVRENAENWLVELHELRLLLEPAAAARAATRIPDSVLEELEELANAISPDDDPSWMQKSREFDYAIHHAVAEYADNLPLCEAIRKCWSFKRLSYDAGQDTEETLRNGYVDHLHILKAFRLRNPDMAEAAMRWHLQHAASWGAGSRIV